MIDLKTCSRADFAKAYQKLQAENKQLKAQLKQYIGEEFEITSQDGDFCNQECYFSYCNDNENGSEL